MLSPKFKFRADVKHLDCRRVFTHSPYTNSGMEPEKEPLLEGSGRKGGRDKGKKWISECKNGKEGNVLT